MSNNYFVTRLDDPRMPAFVTWSKPYIGTLEDFQIATKVMKDGYTLPLDALECLGNIQTTETTLKDYSWEHLNVWGFPYYMKCDAAKITQLVAKLDKHYCRCYKATFYNLYYKSGIGTWQLVDHFWGHPGLLQYEETESGNKVQNILYLIDKYYDTYEEAINSVSNRDELFLASFCDEIFGDG